MTHLVHKPPAFPIEKFTGSRLPDQVFSEASGMFLFFEFARAFSDGAWRLFTLLARESNEKIVHCRCMDPDSSQYYETHFGQAAQFSFAANESTEAYVTQMHNWPPGSIADAIAYRGDAVAWAGDSGHWACWGERVTGLCVLRMESSHRLRKELFSLSDRYLPVLTLSEALTDVASNEMTTGSLISFEKQMHICYLQSD